MCFYQSIGATGWCWSAVAAASLTNNNKRNKRVVPHTSVVSIESHCVDCAVVAGAPADLSARSLAPLIYRSVTGRSRPQERNNGNNSNNHGPWERRPLFIDRLASSFIHSYGAVLRPFAFGLFHMSLAGSRYADLVATWLEFIRRTWQCCAFSVSFFFSRFLLKWPTEKGPSKYASAVVTISFASFDKWHKIWNH